MNPISSQAGLIRVVTQHEAFVTLAALINETCAAGPATIALSGGSTPKAFYDWAVEFHALNRHTLDFAHWHVSDERHVPLESTDSNFGNAARGLLDPLEIPESKRHPWPFSDNPVDDAAIYAATMRARSENRAYDLCLLGLGDDSHTASLWPQCPLIGTSGKNHFAHTEWPGRGHRLTITEAGLAASGKIVVLAFGRNKAAALKAIVEGGSNAKKHPAQVLRQLQNKTLWLVDAAAASELKEYILAERA